MRRPTHADAELLLRLYEIRRDPELRRARKWFLSEFQPTSWEAISAGYLSHSDADRWFRMTTAYWEMVATLVNRGLLHAELYFDHTGEDLQTWEKCKPWIDGARKALRPTYLHQLERLAEEHQAYRARQNAAFLAARERESAAAAKARPASRPARAGSRGRQRRRRTAR
jgi:hypothetical protein